MDYDGNGSNGNGYHGNGNAGHCSKCERVWTLTESQGVCRWCGKQASCQTSTAKTRHVKTSSRRKAKQANGNGNGYDQLDGVWQLFYKVATRFTYKVRRDDTQDFLHDLFLAFAKVKTSYDTQGKELHEGGLMRIAQYELAGYWRQYYRKINGMDCGRCSSKQRETCKDWFKYLDCPKAVKMERLDQLVEDGNGDATPLHELIADDNAVNVAARLEARLILDSYPHRFVKLAYKKYAGYDLDKNEQNYYYRQQKKAQKSLV